MQLFLRICQLNFEVKNRLKLKTMETYSQKPVTFMYFWMNYCDGNHIERTSIVMKNINLLFHLSNDRLHLFLLSDSTQIDDN